MFPGSGAHTGVFRGRIHDSPDCDLPVPAPKLHTQELGEDLLLNRVFLLVLVVLLAGAGVSGYFVEIGGSSPQYRFASAELGPLTAAVSASGNLNAVITVQVGSQVSGQIKELLVDFN